LSTDPEKAISSADLKARTYFFMTASCCHCGITAFIAWATGN